MTSPAAGSTGTAPSGVAGLTETDLSSLYQYIQGRLPQPAKLGFLTGSVNADGTQAAGTGWSSARVVGAATGRYAVTFDTPYVVAPTVVVTPAGGSTDAAQLEAFPSTTGFVYRVVSGGSLQDDAVQFLVTATV